MQDFDFDGFFDNVDTLDDGFDYGSEYEDGFQPFDPELEQEQQLQWA